MTAFVQKLAHWIKLGALAIVLVALLTQVWYLGWVAWWRYVNPGMTSFMEQRLDEMQETRPDAQLIQQWEPYEKISVHLKRAAIASEDDKFIDHDGFDWDGIQKAMEKNERKGRIVAGGSTISQQLAKNLFLSSNKTPWRKAQEALITVMLETLWDKRRILEVYLNVVEWGNGIFGAEAAAQHYFHTSAARLGPEQAARLAVMLPAPRRFEKNPYSVYLNNRVDLILGRMYSADVPQ